MFLINARSLITKMASHHLLNFSVFTLKGFVLPPRPLQKIYASNESDITFCRIFRPRTQLLPVAACRCCLPTWLRQLSEAAGSGCCPLCELFSAQINSAQLNSTKVFCLIPKTVLSLNCLPASLLKRLQGHGRECRLRCQVAGQ